MFGLLYGRCPLDLECVCHVMIQCSLLHCICAEPFLQTNIQRGNLKQLTTSLTFPLHHTVGKKDTHPAHLFLEKLDLFSPMLIPSLGASPLHTQC